MDLSTQSQVPDTELSHLVLESLLYQIRKTRAFNQSQLPAIPSVWTFEDWFAQNPFSSAPTCPKTVFKYPTQVSVLVIIFSWKAKLETTTFYALTRLWNPRPVIILAIHIRKWTTYLYIPLYRYNTCILLEILDTLGSNFPPQPAKFQIPLLSGMDDAQMPMGCLEGEGGWGKGGRNVKASNWLVH